MNKFVIIILFVICALNAHAQENLSCKKFHTGKFKVEGDDNTVISRNKKYQVETNNDVKIKDRIIWLDECTYKLVPKRVAKNTKEIIEDDILTFEITETGQDYYLVRITSDRRDFSVEAKVIKLK